MQKISERFIRYKGLIKELIRGGDKTIEEEIRNLPTRREIVFGYLKPILIGIIGYYVYRWILWL